MNEEQDTENYSSRRPLWTIMVYIAGDNNLSANSIAILQDLEEASRNPDIRLLAGYDSSAPFHKGARYLEIQRRRYQGNYPMNWGLHNDLADPEGHVVVSPDFCNNRPGTVITPTEPTARQGLTRFLKWAMKHHRAQRHMLILFGHGILVAGNTFLSDTTPPSFLRLREFEMIIKKFFGPHSAQETAESRPHLDILACDNCVMNSVEVAYALRDVTDYIIGSQDLMLAVGWPFKKIVQAVQREPRASTKTISRRVLKACARRLLDYSLMERSSDQAVCDLVKLRNHKLFNAIKDLVDVLKEGLAIDYMPAKNDGLNGKKVKKPKYPQIVDAVRLARLEAEAYWDETFVDLYDFCELLLQRAGASFSGQLSGFLDLGKNFLAAEMKVNTDALQAEADNSDPTHNERRDVDRVALRNVFLAMPAGSLWNKIYRACRAVLAEFTIKKPQNGIVPYSYYVCPNLQYSHGLSIYFPWTLPEEIIRFEEVRNRGTRPTDDYQLITAFDEYKGYDFASANVTDWAGLLTQFFRATLRNVRMNDGNYRTVDPGSDPNHDRDMDFELFEREDVQEEFTPAVNLQKSSPDTGEQDDLPRPRIKNYPRRFYLSPADCDNRCKETAPHSQEIQDEEAQQNCVPYLGWQIRGLLADLIKWPKESDDSREDGTP